MSALAPRSTRRLRHGELELALHELRGGATPGVLLLLHELGASSRAWGTEIDEWPGPVFALDFAGHGESDWRAGGAYSPELLAADADAALAALTEQGPSGGAQRCWLAGAGLGAYVALLVAGARAERVAGALLLPGAGLDGGGAEPDPALAPRFLAAVDEIEAARRGGSTFDPMLRTCVTDVRPSDYAHAFALASRRLLLAVDGAGGPPPWWEAVAKAPSSVRLAGDRRSAFANLAVSALRATTTPG